MKTKIKKLSQKEIDILKGHFEPLRFSNEFNIVYEEQVPNTGIVLLDGELALYRKKKPKGSVEPGSLLGIHQLINNMPVEIGCTVKGNSELILIQKSDIIDALNDRNSELYAIIKDSVEETGT